MYGVGVGTIPCGFGASTNAHWLYSAPSSDQGFEDSFQSPKSGLTSVLVTAWWWVYISIHSIWWLSITFHMYGEAMGTIPRGFQALTTAQCLHSAPSSDQGFELASQIWINQLIGNGMMMDLYPHPQHMKVVNHFSYVWRGYGYHSMWISSLNQCTVVSFSAKQWPRIWACFPNLD